jgi:hypothetical protein
MTESHHFDPIERLMEFGLGLGIAQQMVGTMNQAMQQSVRVGSPEAYRASDQQAFYVVVNSAVAGPWSRQQVQSALLTGTLARDAFCWTPGMQQWARAGDIGYFQLPVTPPPPPPPPMPPSPPASEAP